MSPSMITAFTGPHACLSNFYPSKIVMDGNEFPTAEHAFQAAKATSAADFQKIQAASTPAFAKAAGRKIAIRPDWDQVKREIMLRILMIKFERGFSRDHLIETNGWHLVEANTWHDTYWGAVSCSPEGIEGVPLIWTGGHPLAGHNWLGRELMMVRTVIS